MYFYKFKELIVTVIAAYSTALLHHTFSYIKIKSLIFILNAFFVLTYPYIWSHFYFIIDYFLVVWICLPIIIYHLEFIKEITRAIITSLWLLISIYFIMKYLYNWVFLIMIFLSSIILTSYAIIPIWSQASVIFIFWLISTP